MGFLGLFKGKRGEPLMWKALNNWDDSRAWPSSDHRPIVTLSRLVTTTPLQLDSLSCSKALLERFTLRPHTNKAPGWDPRWVVEDSQVLDLWHESIRTWLVQPLGAPSRWSWHVGSPMAGTADVMSRWPLREVILLTSSQSCPAAANFSFTQPLTLHNRDMGTAMKVTAT